MYITMRFYLIVLLLSISTYGLLGGILQRDLFTAYLLQKMAQLTKKCHCGHFQAVFIY